MADEKAKIANPAKDTAAGIQEKLLAGKYKTTEQLEHAYGELEKKLGQAGQAYQQTQAQYAQTQRELEQIRAIAQQQAAQVQNLAPAANWALTYGPALQQQNAHQQKAMQMATQQPGFELLRPDEQQLYFERFGKWYSEQILPQMVPQIAGPLIKNYVDNYVARVAQPFLMQQLQQQHQAFQAQQRALAEVTWDTLNQIAPPEKMAIAKARQQLQLKYSDPRSYNPSGFAEEDFRRDLELQRAKERQTELEGELKRYTEAPLGNGGGASPFRKDTERPAPTNRDDRLRAVVQSAKEADPQGFRETFNGAPTR